MYKPVDFDNLPWNPLRTKKKVADYYKAFGAYKEFQQDVKGIDKDLLFNLIGLVYHKECLLVKDYENITDRQYKALELLDVPVKNGEYPKVIEDIIKHKNVVADKMIIRFCSLMNDQRYTMFVTIGMNYDKLMFKINQEVSGNDIETGIENLAKFTKQADETLKMLDKLKKEIFVGDVEVASKADEELLNYARVPGYPELYASGKFEIK